MSSLLKRIEQGQGGPVAKATEPSADDSRLAALKTRRMPPPGVKPQQNTYYDLKARVQNRLLAELDPTMDVSRVGEVRRAIQELFEQILAEEKIVLTRPERQRLFEQISAEILGFGPLQDLLEQDGITEIMVMGRKIFMLKRKARLNAFRWHSRVMITSCGSLTVSSLR